MNKIFSLSLIIGLIVVACSDPNTIGLEVQANKFGLRAKTHVNQFNSIGGVKVSTSGKLWQNKNFFRL